MTVEEMREAVDRGESCPGCAAVWQHDWCDYIDHGDGCPLVQVGDPIGERSCCPACGDPDCKFPPKCQDAVGMTSRYWDRLVERYLRDYVR